MAGSGKTYQITVQGMRAVEPVVTREYRVIEAESAEAAEARAKDEYYRDCPDIDKNTVDVSLKGRWNTKAIVCMAIPCLLSLVRWHSADGILSLCPTMVSTLMAVAVYSAFIVRHKGLRNSFDNASEIVLTCLTVFFCASFLTLFLGDVTVKIPFFKVAVSGVKFLCLAALLSWLCISAVAGLVWALLFLFALKHVSAVNAAMGFWGVAYILSAFLGIVFQLKHESQYILKSLRNDILGMAARSGKRVGRDIRATSAAAKVIAGTVASAAAAAAVGVPVNLSTDAAGASANAEDARE